MDAWALALQLTEQLRGCRLVGLQGIWGIAALCAGSSWLELRDVLAVEACDHQVSCISLPVETLNVLEGVKMIMSTISQRHVTNMVRPVRPTEQVCSRNLSQSCTVDNLPSPPVTPCWGTLTSPAIMSRPMNDSWHAHAGCVVLLKAANHVPVLNDSVGDVMLLLGVTAWLFLLLMSYNTQTTYIHEMCSSILS